MAGSGFPVIAVRCRGRSAAAPRAPRRIALRGWFVAGGFVFLVKGAALKGEVYCENIARGLGCGTPQNKGRLLLIVRCF